MASDYIDLDHELYAIDDDAFSTEESLTEQKVLKQRVIAPDWQCKNCLWINKSGEILNTVNNKNKCYACKFRKPTHFNCKNYTHCADHLVFGYCREIRDAKDFHFPNIPAYLINIIKVFYIIKLQKKMEITTCPTENGIYIWNFSIIPSKSYIGIIKPKLGECVNVEIGIEENDDDIGMDYEHSFQKYLLDSDDRKITKYCPFFKIGDIITMQLDYNDCSLSFGINNDWYGQFTDINGNLKYEATFWMYSISAEMHLNHLIIIPIIPNQIQRINAKAHTANMLKDTLLNDNIPKDALKNDKNKLLLCLLNKIQMKRRFNRKY